MEGVGQEDRPLPLGVGRVQGHRLDEGPAGVGFDVRVSPREGDGQGTLHRPDRRRHDGMVVRRREVCPGNQTPLPGRYVRSATAGEKGSDSARTRITYSLNGRLEARAFWRAFCQTA